MSLRADTKKSQVYAILRSEQSEQCNNHIIASMALNNVITTQTSFARNDICYIIPL